MKATFGGPRVFFSCIQWAVLNRELSQNFYAKSYGFFGSIGLINIVGFCVFDSCQLNVQTPISTVLLQTFFLDLKHFSVSLSSGFYSLLTKS